MIGPIILALSSLSTSAFASPVASAWFAGWHATEGFPVSSVSWSKYTSMTYAFAYVWFPRKPHVRRLTVLIAKLLKT